MSGFFAVRVGFEIFEPCLKYSISKNGTGLGEPRPVR